MQIVISLLKEPNNTMPLNDCFKVYNTESGGIRKLSLNGIGNPKNIARGTGMCYFGGYFYGACFAKEHRVGSKLIIKDIKKGTTELNHLSFSKAVHSITPFGSCGPYNMILANSTQNDCITIITTQNTKVITEDLFFDFLTKQERIQLDWSKEYEWDDLLHTNCVYQHGNTTFASMFLDYQYPSKLKEIKRWRKDSKKKNLGAVYNLTSQIPIVTECSQPHSIICDSHGNLVYCESGTFSISNINRAIGSTLEGFTRGLVEDREKGGYWVGLSYHRKFSTNIKGAMIQFVSYEMVPEKPIDLSQYGKEVYDLIEFVG